MDTHKHDRTYRSLAGDAPRVDGVCAQRRGVHVLDLRDVIGRKRLVRRTNRSVGPGVALRNAAPGGVFKAPVPHGGDTHSAIRAIVPALTRVCMLLMVVVCGSYGLRSFGPTLAYFIDTESSTGTTGASKLLIDAEGGGEFGLSCNDTEEVPISVTLDTARADAYALRSEFAPGSSYPLCEALSVVAWQDQEKRYEGPLLMLSVPDSASSSVWNIAVSSGDVSMIPDGATCTVALVFEAYCPALGYLGGGFTDRDAVMLSFVKEPCDGEEPCEPGCCGDVDITIDQTITNVTNNTVVSGANSGGNTVVGGGTLVTGESGSTVTIDGGTQSSVVDIDVACGCTDCDPCADAQASAEPISAADTFSGETPHAGTATVETLIGSVREELAERLNGVRR